MEYSYKYPHPAVTADCVTFCFDGARLCVLLIERGREPYKGMWAFPGGFVEIDESADDGVLRELREETGLQGVTARQFHTFSSPSRDPRERVISVAYFAIVKQQQVAGGDDAARAAWFPLDEIPPLAFDHGEMLRMAVAQLRRCMHFEPIAAEFLPDEFTPDELQRVHEAILGK